MTIGGDDDVDQWSPRLYNLIIDKSRPPPFFSRRGGRKEKEKRRKMDSSVGVCSYPSKLPLRLLTLRTRKLWFGCINSIYLWRALNCDQWSLGFDNGDVTSFLFRRFCRENQVESFKKFAASMGESVHGVMAISQDMTKRMQTREWFKSWLLSFQGSSSLSNVGYKFVALKGVFGLFIICCCLTW